MKTKHLLIAVITASLALSMSACAPSTPSDGGGDDVLTIGFITKFPVDFYDIMVDAAKEWDANEPGAEVVFAQGKSGTDDEGEIAAIDSFITQQVDAIAIAPTSPNVTDALQKAVDHDVVEVHGELRDQRDRQHVVAAVARCGGCAGGHRQG